MEKELLDHGLNLNRRHFLSKLSLGLGSAALGSLLITCFKMVRPLNWNLLISNLNFGICGGRNCLNLLGKVKGLQE